MTYYPGASVTPQVGRIYTLRAGLTALVVAELPEDHGWKGTIMSGGYKTVCWWPRGHYSVNRDAHELDIMFIAC